MNNFCFIIDVLDIDFKLPIEIIPNHWFRKATSKQIKIIKKQLERLNVPNYPYESNIIQEKKTNAGTSRSYEPIKSQKDFKYYVISFEGTNEHIHGLEHAANLIEHDINIGIQFLYIKSGVNSISYNPYILSNLFRDGIASRIEAISLTLQELSEISNNYKLIDNLDTNRYPNIAKAVNDFHQTKMIPEITKLKALSYFAIIESLLTHKPKPTDTIDSINRQIKTKMFLLNKRFQRKINYPSYFGQTPHEKVWNTLYDYRSSIAHGANIDFNSTFKILTSHANIQNFLRDNLKLLILYSLDDPDFLTDLKNC